MPRRQEEPSPAAAPHPAVRARHAIALVLALTTALACAGVTYQKPGQPIAPRAGESLVFGTVRFFYDGKEFFPWQVKIDVFPQADTERHVWLLRLGERAVSAELHPDPNGSLAIWLASGDYALVGSTEALGAGVGAFYVVALFRVPSGAAAMYAGDLVFKTESHEGGQLGYAFGEASVEVRPIEVARDSLARKFGTLPEPLVVSRWCASDSLPGFNDPNLAKRGKELLDSGCHGQH